MKPNHLKSNHLKSDHRKPRHRKPRHKSKVIAAIDSSAASLPVLAMSRAVAVALGASLEIVHIEEGGSNDAGSSSRAAGSTARVLSGDPVELLPKLVAENDVVAIVLGAHSVVEGRNRAQLLATILAGRTHKPVIVVPPNSRLPERLHTAVVAVEGTPGKARALQRNIRFLAKAALEIVVVHVQGEDSIPSFSDQVHYETEAHTAEFFARHQIDAPQMRLELRIGAPAAEVLNAIESARAELVAVAWPKSADPGRGAVAREILERSPVPVLLVAV